MIQSPIWEFGSQSLLALTAGYAIIEPISYKLIPAFSKSSTVKEYYDHKKVPFGIVASGDYLYSVLLFLIAQQVIPYVFGTQVVKGIYDWILRFFVFCGIQWIGDFSWYKIITSIPASTTYIDFFQRYTKQVGPNALISDSLYGLVWFGVSQLLSSYAPTWALVFLIVAFLFGSIVASF